MLCLFLSGRFTQVLLYGGDNVISCNNLFSLLAMSIHMSNSTKVLLERFNTFSIQERGVIEVKVRCPKLSCYCNCHVALPHGAMGLSAVCECGIS